MGKEKKTGLGGSLLFQRTEPVETPEHPDVLSVPAPAENPQSAPTSQDRTDPPRGEALKDRYDRCTLYIAPSVNQQLDFAARMERKSRSEIVSEILQAHLPRYEITRKD